MNQVDSVALKQLKENWKWFLTLGIGLVILGTLAVMFAYTSTLFSLIYLGSFMLVTGGFEVIKSFKINKWSSFFLHLFLGIFYIGSGLFILFYPGLNAITLTLFLAIFFVVSGILRIVFALAKKLPHRGWLIFNGLLTIILGILIWKQWPSSGLWVIGMFVGIDAIVTGWTWIMLSLAARKQSKHV